MPRLNWDVTIRKAENGIMVAVGCKSFVFSKKEFGEFLADLEGYINDDVSIGKKYAPEMFNYEEKDCGQTTLANRVIRDYPVEAACPEKFI